MSIRDTGRAPHAVLGAALRLVYAGCVPTAGILIIGNEILSGKVATPSLCSRPGAVSRSVISCRRCCCRRKEFTSRVVWLGQESIQKFPPNVIRNQKYSLLTFIPVVRH